MLGKLNEIYLPWVGFGTNFRITDGSLYDAESSLRRVSGRFFQCVGYGSRGSVINSHPGSGSVILNLRIGFQIRILTI